MESKITPHFRKLPLRQRQQQLCEVYQLSEKELEVLLQRIDVTELTDLLIESAIGTFPLPMGLATGFTIDGQADIAIPMVTEEPSVIAAASLAAALCRTGGGFISWCDAPVMTAQIYLKGCCNTAVEKLQHSKEEIARAVNQLLPKMVERGGGFCDLEVERSADLLALSLHIDVRDAMGANLLNSVAEAMGPSLAALCQGELLMAILTNAATRRRAGASFTLPERFLSRKGLCGPQVCRRIVEANRVAELFPQRAITHNKGIMNGVCALALATGNDTRAVEAAAHLFAQHSGSYLPLTRYRCEEGLLTGQIELPLPLGCVGGTIDVWPWSRLALKILGVSNSCQLNRIAAALGLAQNLAALLALVTEGIQAGHMQLHKARYSYPLKELHG